MTLRYKQIIFDVDDTIIDFAATEDFALHSLFNAHHWPLSQELQRQYHAYNQGLWRRLEQGELTYEQLSEMTFHDFIKDHFNLEIDGNKAMDEYRSYFGEAHQLLPGVEDTLKFAKKQGYKLTVLSNGEKFMQNHLLKKHIILSLIRMLLIISLVEPKSVLMKLSFLAMDYNLIFWVQKSIILTVFGIITAIVKILCIYTQFLKWKTIQNLLN